MEMSCLVVEFIAGLLLWLNGVVGFWAWEGIGLEGLKGEFW
jgi:hypothetical protein